MFACPWSSSISSIVNCSIVTINLSAITSRSPTCPPIVSLTFAVNAFANITTITIAAIAFANITIAIAANAFPNIPFANIANIANIAITIAIAALPCWTNSLSTSLLAKREMEMNALEMNASHGDS